MPCHGTKFGEPFRGEQITEPAGLKASATARGVVSVVDAEQNDQIEVSATAGPDVLGRRPRLRIKRVAQGTFREVTRRCRASLSREASSGLCFIRLKSVLSLVVRNSGLWIWRLRLRVDCRIWERFVCCDPRPALNSAPE